MNDPDCDRLDHLIERLGVKTIAPTRGLPITALLPESGTNEKVPLTGAGAAAPTA